MKEPDISRDLIIDTKMKKRSCVDFGNKQTFHTWIVSDVKNVIYVSFFENNYYPHLRHSPR